MEYKSPFILITRLGNDIGSVLASLDADVFQAADQKVAAAIKRLLIDARLDIRDYELSETRDEQLKNAAMARKSIEQLRALILKASEHNIFGAIDVAQHSAQLDEIVAHLR